jgi:hypothetical protein
VVLFVSTQEEIMKSFVVVLVALASLGAVGCGEQKTEAKPTSTTASPAPTMSASGTPAAKTTAAPGGGW